MALTTYCLNCRQFVTTYDNGKLWRHWHNRDIHCDPRYSPGTVADPQPQR